MIKKSFVRSLITAGKRLSIKLLSICLVLSLVLTMLMGEVQARKIERGLFTSTQGLVSTAFPVESPLEDSSFEEAVKIAEEFLHINTDGTLTLTMPRRVIGTIGRDMHAHFLAGIAAANEKVIGGYLIFDKDFNAHVTNKYLDQVKADLKIHQQLIDYDPDISVSASGNSIAFELGGSANITALRRGGVTRVTWHWWGAWLYLNDSVVDSIVHGATNTAKRDRGTGSLSHNPLDEEHLSPVAQLMPADLLKIKQLAGARKNNFSESEGVR